LRSSDTSERLDLERDLPTSAEDVAALWRIRDRTRLDFDQYLEFLASFPPPPTADLRRRRGPRGERPFELP
jgi:hypothetical protein